MSSLPAWGAATSGDPNLEWHAPIDKPLTVHRRRSTSWMLESPRSCARQPQTRPLSRCRRHGLQKRICLQNAIRGLTVDKAALSSRTTRADRLRPKRSPDNSTDQMRVLDHAHVGIRTHHAMHLIRTFSAHVKGQLAKLGRTLQEKSRGHAAAAHRDISREVIARLSAPIILGFWCRQVRGLAIMGYGASQNETESSICRTLVRRRHHSPLPSLVFSLQTELPRPGRDFR